MLAYALDTRPRGSLTALLTSSAMRATLPFRLARSNERLARTAPTPAPVAAQRPAAGQRIGLRAAWRLLPARVKWAAAGIVMMTPAVAAASIAHIRAASVETRVMGAITRTYGVTLTDGQGGFAGVRRRPGGDSGRVVAPLSGPPPAPFFTMLRWNENRHATFYGVDIGSTGWAGLCEGARSVGAFGLVNKVRRCTGGSTLLSSIVESARGSGNQKRDYGVKGRELADTMAFSVRQDLDDPHTQALIADAAPYVTGVGGSVWGLELSSRVLWGVSPAQLTPARQALLVTAFRRPIRITCLGGKIADEIRGEWNDRVDLARHILLNALPPSAARDAAIVELTAMPAIVAPWTNDPLLTTLTPDKACDAAGNPVARPNLVASSIALRVDEELARATPAQPVTTVRVSTDLRRNREFVQAATDQLELLQRAQGAKLRVQLLDAADGAFLVTDANGHIRWLYSGSGLPNLSTERRTASLGKLIILTAAALDGRRPDVPLCNHVDTRTRAHNADGSAGFAICNGAALVPMDTALARSMILPWLDLARSLRPASLHAVLVAVGAKVPVGFDEATAVGLGMIEISPERLVAMIQALERGAQGLKAKAEIPTIIADARGPDNRSIVLPGRQGVDLSFVFAVPGARDLIAGTARASLTHRNGTLAGAITATDPVTMYELGKTGSDVADEQGNLRSKQVLGAFEQGAYYGGIWARKGILGRDVDMTPMWRWLRDQAHGAPRAAPSPTAPSPTVRKSYTAKRG